LPSRPSRSTPATTGQDLRVREAVTRAHHEECARVVAALTRRFGDLDIAEEAARDHRPKCGQRAVDRLPNVTIPPHRLPPGNSASRYRRSAPMCRYSAR
jgi:predicted RNA polymerase sigma factor